MLIGPCSTEGGCYFKRQPESSDEIAAAIRAMLVSCVEVHRYGGTDPDILARLAEQGRAKLCDHPLEGHPVVSRNLGRFAYPAAQGALAMATAIASWFERFWHAGSETSSARGDEAIASFEFVPSRRYASTPRLFTVSAMGVGEWLVEAPLEVGYLMHLDELLRRNGVSNLQWRSEREWETGAPGKERPY